MPHHPWPFFRATRNTWFVEIDKKQHLLGKHPPDAPPPRRKEGKWDPPPAILQEYHRAMAGQSEAEVEAKPQPARQPEDQFAVAVLDRFLDWCKTHRPKSYAWYFQRIQQFAAFRSKEFAIASLTVRELRPFHVQEWVDSHPGWSSSHKRGSTVAVQRAFSWAEKNGRIDKNPISHVDKPEPGKRDVVLSPEEFAGLVARYKDQEFRDVLEFSWHTGARPQETVRIEARHLDLPSARLIVPPEEAKGGKRFRIIYLDGRALEIVRRLAETHPEGKLFRNTKGAPWTAWAINCRFTRLQDALGRQALREKQVTISEEEVKQFAATLPKTKTVRGRTVAKTDKALVCAARRKLTTKAARKYGKKVFLYAMRPSFSHRLLTVSGLDCLTVSTLLGHADGTMLARVYSHLEKNSEYLREAVRKSEKDATA